MAELTQKAVEILISTPSDGVCESKAVPMLAKTLGVDVLQAKAAYAEAMATIREPGYVDAVCFAVARLERIYASCRSESPAVALRAVVELDRLRGLHESSVSGDAEEDVATARAHLAGLGIDSTLPIEEMARLAVAKLQEATFDCKK